VIEAKVEAGLSGQRIYQDLVCEHGFEGSYFSVRRFVRKITVSQSPVPFRRMECAPGVEAQVDFGTGAPVVTAKGGRRRTYVFRIVLSHSRKAYSEVVYHQTTESFIRCLENAFWHFGGVPQTLVIDNLRAAVSQCDWYEPELNPKIRSFCTHYDVVVLPTKPYTPRHKGKVERGVAYVQDNALKGRCFNSLEEQNRFLIDWETRIADTRIHGTTRKQVGQRFLDVERCTLATLPIERFPCFHEERRRVYRDGHIEIKRAYYSVPPEYVGHAVVVRWDEHTVRVFTLAMDQIAMHVRIEEGRFDTHARHIHSTKISTVEQGTTRLLKRARHIGPHAAQWAEELVQERGIESGRSLAGLLSLPRHHDHQAIDRACEVALSHGAYRLRIIRKLIPRMAPTQSQFEFMQEHAIIRQMSDYQDLVEQAIPNAYDRKAATYE
jgi:transposase